MTIFFGFIYVLLITPYWLIFLIIALIVFSDVLTAWNIYFKPQDPYVRQLTMGSHGLAFLVITPLFVSWFEKDGLVRYLPTEFAPWLWTAAYAFMAMGAFWLVISIARTRMYMRDAALIVRAIVKLATGLALAFIWFNDIFPPRDWRYNVGDAVFRYLFIAAVFLSFWLITTAAAKLLLLIRPFPWEYGETSVGEKYREWKSTFWAGWHVK